MEATVDASTLDRQPRQRRAVYECLAESEDGRSVKDLLVILPTPEPEVRETLRKLEAAGLAQRLKGVWRAVPIQ